MTLTNDDWVLVMEVEDLQAWVSVSQVDVEFVQGSWYG